MFGGYLRKQYSGREGAACGQGGRVERSWEGLAGEASTPWIGGSVTSTRAPGSQQVPRGRPHLLLSLQTLPAHGGCTQWKGWATAQRTVPVTVTAGQRMSRKGTEVAVSSSESSFGKRESWDCGEEGDTE